MATCVAWADRDTAAESGEQPREAASRVRGSDFADAHLRMTKDLSVVQPGLRERRASLARISSSGVAHDGPIAEVLGDGPQQVQAAAAHCATAPARPFRNPRLGAALDRQHDQELLAALEPAAFREIQFADQRARQNLAQQRTPMRSPDQLGFVRIPATRTRRSVDPALSNICTDMQTRESSINTG